jgi:hypothetical protein
MHLTSAKKGAMAVAMALTMFLAMATPASANTVNLTITGGTLTAAGNTFGLAPGSNPNTPPCTVPASGPTATFNAGGTGVLGGTWKSTFQLGTPPTGQWYQADFSVLAGAFTWTQTGAGPPTWTYSIASAAPNHFIFRVVISRIPPCDKSDVVCTLTVKMTATGTVTSTTALPTYTPGSITINATSVAPHISVSGCSAPFASWAGQTASIAGLTLT